MPQTSDPAKNCRSTEYACTRVTYQSFVEVAAAGARQACKKTFSGVLTDCLHIVQTSFQLLNVVTQHRRTHRPAQRHDCSPLLPNPDPNPKFRHDRLWLQRADTLTQHLPSVITQQHIYQDNVTSAETKHILQARQQVSL